MGKVVNRAEYDILGHFEPLWWEKIGKVANRVELAIASHSEPLQWENIGKVANWAKLAIPSHSEPLQWEKLQTWWNWPLRIFESFHSKAPRNDPQWQIWPKKWLRFVKMANFGHFAGFSPKVSWDWLGMANFTGFTTFPIFSHQKWLRKTQKGQFHLTHSFSHLFSPKWPRMTWNGNFARFATFPIFFHQSGSE